jgi:hypothetical protein
MRYFHWFFIFGIGVTIGMCLGLGFPDRSLRYDNSKKHYLLEIGQLSCMLGVALLVFDSQDKNEKAIKKDGLSSSETEKQS